MNIKKLNIFLKDYRKFIPVSEQPSGDDLFLGFLKYISSSATKVQQRYAKEKKDFANLK